MKVIDERYCLIQSNPEVTRQYVEEAILPIQDMLESLDEKINILLPKQRKEKTILPLRDPINTDLLNIFVSAAGSNSKYKQDGWKTQTTTGIPCRC